MVPKQAQLLLANLDRAAAILRDKHLVADRHARRNALAVPVERAGAHGYDFSFVELLDGGLGQEDAGCGFGFGFEALHEDAVEERGDGADGFYGGLGGVRWLVMLGDELGRGLGDGSVEVEMEV